MICLRPNGFFSGKEGTALCDITLDEGIVLQKLEKLWDDKAAGADELVPRFLNLIKWEFACPLTILFQSIMASGVVPDDWKVANVVLINKGGSRNEVTSYRPISLTSQVCKIFETIVGSRLSNFWSLIILLEIPSMGLFKVVHV